MSYDDETTTRLMPSNSRFDADFKIIFIGESGVGKSATLLSYLENEFPKEYNETIGVDFKLQMVWVGSPSPHDDTEQGRTIKLQFWDSAGQERFRMLTSSVYKGAHAAIVMFDLTDRKSFEKLDEWMEDLEQKKETDFDIIKVIVGNKLDLKDERVIERSEAQEFADSKHAVYFEISAKQNSGIEEVFTYIIDILSQSQTYSRETFDELSRSSDYRSHQSRSSSSCHCCSIL